MHQVATLYTTKTFNNVQEAATEKAFQAGTKICSINLFLCNFIKNQHLSEVFKFSNSPKPYFEEHLHWLLLYIILRSRNHR